MSPARPLEVVVAATTEDTPEDDAERFYGSTLAVRPSAGTRLAVNFVSTIDGVVALGADAADVTVSGGSVEDRTLMALLRSEADVIVVGAGTLRSLPRHRWTPGFVSPDDAALWRQHRTRVRGDASPAPLIVVSANAAVPPRHPAIATPDGDVVVLTRLGAEVSGLPAHVRIVQMEGSGTLQGLAVRSWIEENLSPRFILCEGGPHLFGSLLADGSVDELFLTVAPRIAGRRNDSRSALVQGWAAPPRELTEMTLLSARRAADTLFLRYRVDTV
ncbi:MAG: dihydrofolate reductase family protein [Candidatus Dormibacteria bacterium]